MKSFVLAASLLIGINAHASYKGEVLRNWLTVGITQGVDSKGKACEVVFNSYLDINSINLNMAEVPSHKTPRFNSYISNRLVTTEETATSLYIEVQSTPTNSYTSAVKQTISLNKTSKGTEVSVTEKELRIFSSTLKAICIIP